MAFEVKGWMTDELQRRKQLVRDLWSGKQVGRIPLDVRITVPSDYAIREQFLDGEKQMAAALASARATWTDLANQTDCIPAMRPDVGCSCLASAFGTAYYWGDSVQQTPGVRDYIITDLENQVDALTVPDACTESWLPEGLKRIRMFAEAGEGLIPVSLLDAYSHKDLAAMKHSLKGKGFIYLYWDGGVEPVHWYRYIMELMTPDVIVVPILSFQTGRGGLFRLSKTDADCTGICGKNAVGLGVMEFV